MTSETEMSIELLTGLHSEVGGNVCGYDDDPWPCDVGTVLMALAAVQSELVEARDEYAEAYESGREAGDESGYEKCAEDRDAEIDALKNQLAAAEEQLAEARAERDKAEDGWNRCGLYWQDQMQRITGGYKIVLGERDEARAQMAEMRETIKDALAEVERLRMMAHSFHEQEGDRRGFPAAKRGRCRLCNPAPAAVAEGTASE